MVLWITRTFQKPLKKMADLLGVDEAGGAALVATLASYFPALDMIPRMNEKARLLVLTFGDPYGLGGKGFLGLGCLSLKNIFGNCYAGHCRHG